MSIFRSHNAPRLRPMEIPASFVSRLAAWLRYTNAKLFCTDFGLDFEGVSAGRPEQLQELADLTGSSADDLGHGPVRSGRRFLVDGQLFSTAYLDRVELWVCPECVAEDMAAAPNLPPEASIAVRRDNIVSAIGGCLTHRRSLVSVGRSDWRYGRHDTSLLTMDIPVSLSALEAASQPMPPSPIDLFVRGRFEGVADPSALLSNVPLHQVLKLTGHFGNWALTGGKAHLRHLPRNELNKIYSAGLELLTGGTNALSEQMEKMVEATHARGNIPVRRGMDKIHYLLEAHRDQPAFSVIQQMIQDAWAQSSYRRGDMQDTTHRKTWWRPALAVARDLGIGLEPATAFARAAGAIHPSKPGWIDAPKLSDWVALRGGLVPVWTAAREMGATEFQMAALIEHGLLEPVVEKAAKKGAYTWLRRDDVQAFLDRLPTSEVCQSMPNGKATISGMLRRTRGSLPVIHEAIVLGNIWVGRLAGTKPYASILLDIAEVLKLLGSVSPEEEGDAAGSMFSGTELARRCGIGSVAAHRLIESGFFRAEVHINPNTGFKRKSIHRSEAERFERDFITAAKLARQMKIQPRDLVSRLLSKGVEPVKTDDAPITIFRRSELPDLPI